MTKLLMYKRYKCSFCKKDVEIVVDVYINGNDMSLCIKCFLAYVLNEIVSEMITHGNDEDLRHIVRVLKGINDLVEDNPYTQPIMYVINKWMEKYPKPLYVDELRSRWNYRVNLDRVIEYLASTGILVRTRFTGSMQEHLSPGDVLKKLLQKYSTSKEFFNDIIKAITGIAIIRYLGDPENPKLRMIYVTLQSVLLCIEEGERKPYGEEDYICRLCNARFSEKIKIKTHILRDHALEIDQTNDEALNQYIQIIIKRKLGERCKYTYFIKEASTYGVKFDRYLRYLVVRGVLIPREGDEVVEEIDGEKYVAVDEAWIRLRERMRIFERQLIRKR